MIREYLYAKINGAVTEVSWDCEGSITIDFDFMDKVGLTTYQLVHVNNISQPGKRIITYVLPGKRGTGIIALNGAAAWAAAPGDKVHINAFCQIEYGEVRPVPEVLNLPE